MAESKRKQVFGHYLLGAIRVALGAVLLWASLAKIKQPYDFLTDVYDYQMLNSQLVLFVAMCLPWVELLVSVCLLGGIFVEGAMAASCVLGAIFTTAVGTALLKGLPISCGCFAASPGDQRIGYMTLIRSMAVLLAAAVGLLLLRKWTEQEPARAEGAAAA
jgi:Methylamine utilisation protein MauE